MSFTRKMKRNDKHKYPVDMKRAVRRKIPQGKLVEVARQDTVVPRGSTGTVIESTNEKDV